MAGLQTSSSQGLGGSESASGSCHWGALSVQSSRTHWLGAHIEHLLFCDSVQFGLCAQQDMHGRKRCPGSLFIAGDKGEAVTSVLTHLPGSDDLDRPAAPVAASPTWGPLRGRCVRRGQRSLYPQDLLGQAVLGAPLWTVINVGNPVTSSLCSSHPRGGPGGGRAKLKLSTPW